MEEKALARQSPEACTSVYRDNFKRTRAFANMHARWAAACPACRRHSTEHQKQHMYRACCPCACRPTRRRLVTAFNAAVCVRVRAPVRVCVAAPLSVCGRPPRPLARAPPHAPRYFNSSGQLSATFPGNCSVSAWGATSGCVGFEQWRQDSAQDTVSTAQNALPLALACARTPSEHAAARPRPY